MRISFLFWNLNKSALQDHVASIAAQHKVDIVILAECQEATDVIEAELLRATGFRLKFVPTSGSRAKTQTYLGSARIKMSDQFVSINGRLLVRRMRIDGCLDALLATVHFQSKVNNSEVDQTLESTNLADDIRTAEADSGITKTY